MTAVRATTSIEMQFSGSDGAWTDIKDDVYVSRQVKATYGIMGEMPKDRMARTGTLDFILRNDDSNSGGLAGYYSPDHANLRSGFAIGAGTRLKFTYSGSTFYKWTGALAKINPAAGIGLTVEEGHYSLDRVLAADEVFALSTLKEVKAVDRVGTTPFAAGPITGKLAAAYQARVLAETS